MGAHESAELQEEFEKVKKYSFTVDDLHDLKQQFEHLDTNRDGKLDRHEFAQALGFLGLSSSLLSNFLFNAFDLDGNGNYLTYVNQVGYLDFNEFLVGLVVLTRGSVGIQTLISYRLIVVRC